MELLSRIADVIFRFIIAWWDFGMLLISVTINIPLFIAGATVLTAIPIVYFYFALQVPGLLMGYMFAVFVGVLVYTIKQWGKGNEIEDPLDGRSVSSEATAGRRSRSLMGKSRRR